MIVVKEESFNEEDPSNLEGEGRKNVNIKLI